MSGHYFGPWYVEVNLSNGERAYLMCIEEGCFMTTKKKDAAARFLTEAGARKFFKECSYLPCYTDRSAYIVDGFTMKSRGF